MHFRRFLRSLGRWTHNLFISVDQFGNAITGGDPDETISSRLGRLRRAYRHRFFRKRPASAFIANVLDAVFPGHTTKSIEPHRGDKGVLDKPDDLARKPPHPPHDRTSS